MSISSDIRDDQMKPISSERMKRGNGERVVRPEAGMMRDCG
jgi:hypothetical protein